MRRKRRPRRRVTLIRGFAIDFAGAGFVLKVASGPRTGSNMQDIWMLVFTVAFFALAFGYVQGCHKLR